MYRFGSIKDLTTMKNICMYIRIYNELDKKGKGVQETAIHDYIVDNYEKDIPLFDLFEFKRLASTITGKETVPTIQELDAIIGEYIKYVDKNAIALYKDVEADKKALNSDKFTTYTKESYTGSELCAIENTVRSKFKALKLLISVLPIIFAIAVTVGGYAILYNIEADILQQSLATQFIRYYLPTFAGSWLVMLIILALCGVYKAYHKLYPIISLLDVNYNKLERLNDKLVDDQDAFDAYIKEMQFIAIEDGKMTGADKLNYYLRIDNTFAEKKKGDEEYQNKKFVKKLEINERIARKKRVGMVGSETIKVDGWSLMESSSIEKKNCNKDLVSRISLLTDSLKDNKLADTKEYNELVEIYCGDLSGATRETKIVKQNDQIKMYDYYVQMVEKLEPYEKFVKQKCGLDYDGEKYAERVATDDEKQFVLNYIWYIIETELKRVNYVEKFKDKVYKIYTDIKTNDIHKIVSRVDLYKLYFNFLNDFENLIVK